MPRIVRAHDRDKQPRTQDVEISESVDFGDLLLSKPVLEGLQATGYVKPSPIQLKAIPLAKCGFGTFSVWDMALWWVVGEQFEIDHMR